VLEGYILKVQRLWTLIAEYIVSLYCSNFSRHKSSDRVRRRLNHWPRNKFLAHGSDPDFGVGTMVSLRVWLFSSLNTLQFYTATVKADGTGLIGFGKTLYSPTCAFACRNVIRKQTLACTPEDTHTNHGTAHNPVSTPPECFVQDKTFLKTMALCIDVYCSLSDKPSKSLLEDYWVSHLGTGTLGDYQYVPIMSYQDALVAARGDEDNTRASPANTTSAKVPAGLKPYKVSSSLALTTGGSSALNSTRLVAPVQWQLQWNYMSDFEINEKGHSTMT
jgi:hypothetical protein